MDMSVSVLQKNYVGNTGDNTSNGKPRVLFVDDDIAVVLSLKRSMRDEFQVEVALGAQQALQTLEQTGPVAAIVSDMRMPDVDGASFLAEVRQRAPTTTRIMLTGDTASETSVKAINTGQVFRFLQKPYPLPALRRVLRDAVDEHLRLNEHQRLSGDLLAMFQHEFRTPLHQMMGFASLLQSGDLDGEKVREYADLITSSGNNLVDMTDNLVMLTSLREGRIRPFFQPVEVRQLISGLLKDLQLRLDEKLIDLSVVVDPGMETLRFDPDLFGAAMKALLSNAIKFGEPNSLVIIEVGFGGENSTLPCVDVINGGSGFDDERAAHFMDPFMQNDMGATRRFGGLGLGLPLARAIAELHDGSLHLLNRPDVGVRAGIRLSEASLT